MHINEFVNFIWVAMDIVIKKFKHNSRYYDVTYV